MDISSLEKFWVALLTLFILDVSKTASSPTEEQWVQGLNPDSEHSLLGYLFKQKFPSVKGGQMKMSSLLLLNRKKKARSNVTTIRKKVFLSDKELSKHSSLNLPHQMHSLCTAVTNPLLCNLSVYMSNLSVSCRLSAACCLHTATRLTTSQGARLPDCQS